MIYKNLEVEKQEDGSFLVSVDIVTPKKYKLLFSGSDADKALDEIMRFLKSENATEETEQ